MIDDRPVFLVCWGYGTGGVWGLVRANTEDEITERYPELQVVHERPSWLDEETYRQLADLEYDIDGAPWGLLNSVLESRARDERRVGDDRPVFLVGIGDPETGRGRWIFLRAHTYSEIRNRYPELVIVHGRPDWREQAVREHQIDNVAVDIDAPPSGLLAEVIACRGSGAAPNLT